MSSDSEPNESEPSPSIVGRVAAWIVGGTALVFGAAAFIIPMQHAGPLGMPGRGIVGGLACGVVAAVLFAPRTSTLARGLAFAVSPVVIFLALYASLAEVEEVVVLYAPNADLRLWIVDHDGVEWVSMSPSKAADNGLDGAELKLLRAGGTRCVIPRIVQDDTANRRTFDLRQEKYAVQRLAVSTGFFGDGPGPETITLRLDPCS